MTKKERLSIILDLINSEELSTQEELTLRLKELGYDISQSTISRDINELNLVKGEGSTKKYKYVQAKVDSVNASSQIVGLLKQITVSINSANNLVVIKTLSGNASAAGMAVDNMHFPQVIGTVAGDDTLLIIAKSNSDAEVVVKALRNL
jgi:transcriptional regulator of arginine metabolism